MFPFPVHGASQVKLARDGEGAWYLLGFRGDPNDDPQGTDFVDVYGARFNPFAITPLLYSVQVTFKPGDTGFASTGTHHVEPSGPLLLSSSYRWARRRGTRRLQLRLTGRRVPLHVTGPYGTLFAAMSAHPRGRATCIIQPVAQNRAKGMLGILERSYGARGCGLGRS